MNRCSAQANRQYVVVIVNECVLTRHKPLADKCTYLQQYYIIDISFIHFGIANQ